jgi:hypothetical protein
MVTAKVHITIKVLIIRIVKVRMQNIAKVRMLRIVKVRMQNIAKVRMLRIVKVLILGRILKAVMFLAVRLVTAILVPRSILAQLTLPLMFGLKTTASLQMGDLIQVIWFWAVVEQVAASVPLLLMVAPPFRQSQHVNFQQPQVLSLKVLAGLPLIGLMRVPMRINS